MKFSAPVSIQWIASLIDAEISGDENGTATGINEIHSVQEGDIVFAIRKTRLRLGIFTSPCLDRLILSVGD